MRAHSLAIALVAALAAPAFSLDLVEMKDGKTYAAESVRVVADRLRIKLFTAKAGTRVEFSVPISRVVPEFVYYAWAEQIAPEDVRAHLELARWARANGVFRQALREYELVALQDEETRRALPEIREKMHEEEATWLFEEAEHLFKEDEVNSARLRTDLILQDFADTQEVARAKALRSMIVEREQFLSDKRRQEETDRRARKHRLLIDQQVSRVEAADRLVRDARMRHWVDALGRFKTAGYTYRSALMHFDELRLTVEAEELHKMLQHLVEEVETRIVSTFLKLADLRFMTGDIVRAMDAVHEVMSIDPTNPAAADLRDRILDASQADRFVAGTLGYWPAPYGSPGYRRTHYNPKPYPTPTDPFRKHRRWSLVRRYYR